MEMTRKAKRMLLFTFLICLHIPSMTSQNITQTHYDNGCILEHEKQGGPPVHRFSGKLWPFLNCSGLMKTSFDLSSMPENIKSISLANNRLTQFDVDDIATFTSLGKLDLDYNRISVVRPASQNGTPLKFLKNLSLKNNSLEAVPGEAFANFSRLSSLDLSHNKISAITEADFSNLDNLGVLRLGGNPLKALSPNALRKFDSTLFVISIQFAQLREIPKCLMNMTLLMYVSLVGNQITHLPRHAFAGDTSLRYIELANNRIQKIDRLAFSDTNQLTSLDLSDNLIEVLPWQLFDGMDVKSHFTIELYENPISCNCSMRWFKSWIDSLEYRDVRFTCAQPARNHGKSWDELTPYDFRCDRNDFSWKENCSHVLERIEKPPPATPKPPESTECPRQCKCYNSTGDQYYPKSVASGRLRKFWWFPIEYPYVDCSNAKLSSIPSSIRRDVKTLNFIKNNIKTFDIRYLKTFSDLQILHFESSRVRTLKLDRTTVLPSLKYLSLQHNNITSISRQHLRSFPNLKTLRISNNKIKAFQGDLFTDTRSLRRLYLGPNPAVNFNPSILSDLNLYSLSLRNLSLRTIPALKFVNLTYLDLSDNFITAIDNNTFVHAPNMVKIALGNNMIKNIGRDAFNNSNHLKGMDLSENVIERLPERVFDPLLRDGLQIELWMNPLNCDCHMRWFKQWIEELEQDDPTTDIRFSCKIPMRTYGKASDQLRVEDFTCQPEDKGATPSKDQLDVIEKYYLYMYGPCHTNGQMALAVTLTMIFTTLFHLIIRWCLNRRHRKYHKPDSDVVPLSMD